MVGVSPRHGIYEVVPERLLRNGSTHEKVAEDGFPRYGTRERILQVQNAKSGGTAFPRPDIRMGDFLFL